MSERHQYRMGLIGNCSYLAYVDDKGNIPWLCWPKFDSTFVFGGLLDSKKGGHFFVRPVLEDSTSRQSYVENTNVLETHFSTASGEEFKVVDFAPRFKQYDRHYKPLMLIRKIVPLKGRPRIQVGCQAMGEYGELCPQKSFGSNHIRFMGMPDQLRLTSNIPLNYISEETDILLEETKYLVLTYGPPLEAALEETCERFLDATIKYWRQWVEHCSIPNLFQKEVIRSSLVLKLHQYEDTGAIIASGTTSLPEMPGEGRNWDYRYFWVRDCFYTLQAFNLLGHFEELDYYSKFLQNVATRVTDRFQPMYTILGAADIEERELPLEGYLGNGPVRVGNAAYTQVQNDVYGQVLLSLLPLYVDRRIIQRRRLSDVGLIKRMLSFIDTTMDEPDAGLWEFRGRKERHGYTYLFHWAGSKAAAKIGRVLGDKGLQSTAEKLAKKSAQRLEECFSKKQKAYTSHIGSEHFDASLVQMITMGYFADQPERAQSHLETLRKHLAIKGSPFWYRYNYSDDFGKPSVAFLVCGFWYAQAQAYLGDVDGAMESFEQLVSSSNELGLFSEDVDPKNLSQWGNFVQTYSHVGLINTAFEIERKRNKPNFL